MAQQIASSKVFSNSNPNDAKVIHGQESRERIWLCCPGEWDVLHLPCQSQFNSIRINFTSTYYIILVYCPSNNTFLTLESDPECSLSSPTSPHCSLPSLHWIPLFCFIRFKTLTLTNKAKYGPSHPTLHHAPSDSTQHLSRYTEDLLHPSLTSALWH